MDLVDINPGLLVWTLSTLAALIALVSIILSGFKGKNTKLAWVFVVIFLPVVGSALYFIYGKRTRANISR